MTTTATTNTSNGTGTEGQAPATGTEGAPQEGTQGTGQAPATNTSTSTQGTEGQGSTEGQGQAPTPEQLAEARREAANYRRQLRDAEAERDRLAQAQMTEAERVAAERDRLAAELETTRAAARTAQLRAEVTAAAAAAGIPADDAMALLAETITYDDETGAPVGVQAAVQALAKAKPYLVQHTTPAQFGPGATSTPGGPVTYTRAQLADRAFYEANREDILRAANEGRIVG